MTEPEEIRYIEIKCTGLVQGVFFRAATKKMAILLGLKGWVKNLPDGSVLMNVYGRESEVNKLIKWCEKGPILAKVSNVEVRELTTSDKVTEHKSFDITY